MHTQFVIKSNGGERCFNVVKSNFANRFGSGNVFSKLSVSYTHNGSISVNSAAAEYLGAEYLGNGAACLTFRRVIDFAAGSALTSFSFCTEDNSSVNIATPLKGVNVSGSTEIIARAYIKINGGGIIFSEKPEPLFEYLAGITDPVLTAVCGNAPDTAYGDQAVSVERENVSGGIVLSALPNSSECKYMAFFADKRHIFSVKANLVSASSDERSASGRLILTDCDQAEITSSAGSALTETTAVKRLVGKSIGVARELPSPFYIKEAVTDGNASAAAIVHDNGVTLIKKNGKFTPCNAFDGVFYGALVLGACFSPDYLFVLKSGRLDRVVLSNASSGNVYSVDGDFENVFAVNNDTVILTRKSGFSVFTLQANTITAAQTQSLASAIYSFDGVTKTLTAVRPENMDQFRFNGAAFTQKSAVVETNSNLASCVGGRWGKVFVAYASSVFVYDMFENAGVYHSFRGGSGVACDSSGTIFAVRNGNSWAVYRADEDFTQIGAVNAGGRIIPMADGLIDTAFLFHPFSSVTARFEIVADSPDETFSVYTETPYFTDYPLNLTFEAVV
ncbi:MAG: hypothetical protein J6Z34_04555 [Clostridia bacterium]|nr:hypothetical protein [Clostridia bacterium]